MKLLREKFFDKDAWYLTTYKDFIFRLTRVADVSTSSGTDAEQEERGKAFGRVYECFMYAVMVGIKAKNPLPFERGKSSTKFLQVKAWKPDSLVEYIFASMLALSEFSFAEIESLDEKQADDKALELVKLMEYYANGGFELMTEKSKESPHYFENPGNVVSFLQTVKSVGS